MIYTGLESEVNGFYIETTINRNYEQQVTRIFPNLDQPSEKAIIENKNKYQSNCLNN